MVAVSSEPPVKLKNKYARRCNRCQKWLLYGQEVLWYPGKDPDTGKSLGISHLTPETCEAAYPDWVMPMIEKGSLEYDAHYEQVSALFAAHPWTFAKTMPQTPHWWTLLKQWPNKDEFWYCAGMIRALGVPYKFGSTTYLGLVIDDWQYWMPPPFDADPRMWDLLNRARVDGKGPEALAQGFLY